MTINGVDLIGAATRVSHGLLPKPAASNVVTATAASATTPTSAASSSGDITSNDF